MWTDCDLTPGEMPHLERARLILAVQDLLASTAFWCDVLGFTRDFGDGSDGWSWLSRDGFSVGLGECASEPPAGTLGDHSYVAYVTVDDVDALFAEYQGRGVPLSAPPTSKPWGMREFAMRTPDGHRMTFGSPSRAT
jgi:catechol 2,3-dioxygenase-like lactoylglutathione lyase family enzyme